VHWKDLAGRAWCDCICTLRVYSAKRCQLLETTGAWKPAEPEVKVRSQFAKVHANLCRRLVGPSGVGEARADMAGEGSEDVDTWGSPEEEEESGRVPKGASKWSKEDVSPVFAYPRSIRLEGSMSCAKAEGG
jgi:hypothetical protein